MLTKNGVYTEGPLMEKKIEPNQQFGDTPFPITKLEASVMDQWQNISAKVPLK